MPHIGLFFPPVPGHANPMATLGRTLAKRGYRVTAFQLPGLRGSIEPQGLEFWPLGSAGDQSAQIEAAVAQLGSRTGLRAARFTLDCGRRFSMLICEHAPQELRKAAVDLLVIDPNAPAAATVAEHLGIPFVNAGSLPLNRDPAVPPPFVPWKYRDQLWAKALNGLAYRAFDRLAAPLQSVLNSYRRAWHLRLIRQPDDTLSRLAQMYQVTEDFDFPRSSKPSHFYCLGPFCDDSRPATSFPYGRLNGKPLVYASFGTLLDRGEQTFRTIAEACARLDAQLVIAAGRTFPRVNEAKLPGSPVIVESAPQLELLARATLCITHAGLNTVMEALRFGVPMVCVPVTNDQPAVAARLKRTGAGEIVPLRRLNSGCLRAVIERVLHDPSYRMKAKFQQGAIQNAGGVEKAADIVTAVLEAVPAVPA